MVTLLDGHWEQDFGSGMQKIPVVQIGLKKSFLYYDKIYRSRIVLLGISITIKAHTSCLCTKSNIPKCFTNIHHVMITIRFTANGCSFTTFYSRSVITGFPITQHKRSRRSGIARRQTFLII